MAQRLGCHSVAKQALIMGKVYLSWHFRVSERGIHGTGSPGVVGTFDDGKSIIFQRV